MSSNVLNNLILLRETLVSEKNKKIALINLEKDNFVKNAERQIEEINTSSKKDLKDLDATIDFHIKQLKINKEKEINDNKDLLKKNHPELTMIIDAYYKFIKDVPFEHKFVKCLGENKYKYFDFNNEIQIDSAVRTTWSMDDYDTFCCCDVYRNKTLIGSTKV